MYGKVVVILCSSNSKAAVKLTLLNRIPFNRATELAEKFKILDVLYPLFVDEPSIYLCSPIGAAQQHSNNNEVIPSPPSHITNKCNNNNMAPLPAFHHHRHSLPTTTTADGEYPSLSTWDSSTRSSFSLLNQPSSSSLYDQGKEKKRKHYNIYI